MLVNNHFAVEESHMLNLRSRFCSEALVEVARDYESRGAKVVAISSNSVQTHPQDGPDLMAQDAKEFGAISHL